MPIPPHSHILLLTKDLRQLRVSENYTTTTFYVSHSVSPIYRLVDLDYLLFTAVFPILVAEVGFEPTTASL